MPTATVGKFIRDVLEAESSRDVLVIIISGAAGDGCERAELSRGHPISAMQQFALSRIYVTVRQQQSSPTEPLSHVNFPTHIHGHSLDVMIFSNRCDVLSVSPSDTISDNFSVVADLKIPTDHSHTVPQTITYRKLKAINMEAFKADINNSDLIKNPKSNATELAQQYDSVLSTLIDFHAPLATKKISPKLLTRG